MKSQYSAMLALFGVGMAGRILPNSFEQYLVPVFGPVYSKQGMWGLWVCCLIGIFLFRKGNTNLASILASVWLLFIPFLSSLVFRLAEVISPLYASNLSACCLFLLPTVMILKILVTTIVDQLISRSKTNRFDRSRCLQYVLMLGLGFFIGEICVHLIVPIPRCGILLIFSGIFAGVAILCEEWRKLLWSRRLVFFGAAMILVVLGWTQQPRCCPAVFRVDVSTENLHLRSMRESATGVVSVVFDSNLNATFLKCDHSVLGGIYEDTADSVFGIFYVQEAIALLRGRSLRQGLIWGLGAGIAAKGLKLRGARLDVFELDLAVAQAAFEHFGLKLDDEDGLFIMDALTSLETSSSSLLDYRGRQRRLAKGNYDFVLHDVFTGGGVPAELFSAACFLGLKSVLRPSMGVLVVNFYGTVSGQLTYIIHAQLTAVFKYVRVFRDEHTSDTSNLVFFASDSALVFRKPSERDAYGSVMRYQFLDGFGAWELRLPSQQTKVPEADISPLLDDISRMHWAGIRQVFSPEFWRLF